MKVPSKKIDIHSIRYINLDRRPDRREHVEALCNQYFKIPVRHQKAFDGDSLNISGPKACFMSHITIWQEIAASSTQENNFVIILEDDINVRPDLPVERVDQLLTKMTVPSTCEIIFLSHLPPKLKSPSYQKPNEYRVELMARRQYCWTESYAITPSLARKLLPISATLMQKHYVDEVLRAVVPTRYALNPGIFFQDHARFGTDIQRWSKSPWQYAWQEDSSPNTS